MSYLTVENLFSEVKQYNFKRYSPIHYHETVELYYLSKGKVTFFVDEKPYELSKGDLIIIPNGSLHSSNSEYDYTERLLLNFDENHYFEDVIPQLKYLCEKKLICIPKEKRLIVEDMFYKVNNEWTKNKACKKALIKTYITELILYLYRYRIPNQTNHQAVDELIQAVSEYISLNYNHELTLSQLSRQFNLSESYLSKRFKSVVGTNINEYINYVRINNAEKLLRNRKLPITEIAILCGFNDSSYFASIFKKMKGITPYKFMKKYNKQQAKK